MRNLTQIMYILQNGNTNQYKIGITNDLNRRLAQLQTGCPNELKVIKMYNHYDRKVIERYERVLHNYFTKCGCRIRPNGEWFELRKPDIMFLCQPNSIAEQNKLVNELCKMIGSGDPVPTGNTEIDEIVDIMLDESSKQNDKFTSYIFYEKDFKDVNKVMETIAKIFRNSGYAVVVHYYSDSWTARSGKWGYITIQK